MKQIFTVSELTRSIQFLLESSFDRIWIEGEVSNLRRPGSGHVYFTLKDERSQIRAVVFRQALRALKFDLEDGMHILCRATLSVYEQRGEYQLIIDMAEPKGIGALQIAFEQLKAKLQAEGLFDSDRKRPIPFLARRIGVITSPSGAVIRDILNITARRFPSVHILIAPVRVQGSEAAAEIVDALDRLNKISDLDVIILARGGGTLEDLAPFNSEQVARAVYGSRIPVISAVGHEVDFTIADFVADLRAPTPSAAAELVVPLHEDLKGQIADLRQRLYGHQKRLLDGARNRIAVLSERLRHPGRQVADYRIHLDTLAEELRAAMLNRIAGLKKEYLHTKTCLGYFNPIENARQCRMALANNKKDLVNAMVLRLKALEDRYRNGTVLLENLNPLAVLKRGYSIVRTFPEGKIVSDVSTLTVGNTIEVKLASGELMAEIRRILKR